MCGSERFKRALVTGGAGFIGSHLCDSLLSDGMEVVCVDSLITGRKENLARAFSSSGFRFLSADICEHFELDVDCIFHLASPASPKDYLRMPIETLRVNSVGTMNCLDLALRKKARILIGSTSEVYGNPEVSPQPEDYFGNVNPVGPRSCYDEGKRFSEALSKAFERVHGLEVVIVRIFNTYGPRMRRDDGRVVPNFVCQALQGSPITVYGDGSQTRSFCYIRDMVGGLKKAMFSDNAVGEVLNLGNSREMRIIDLARLVIEKTGSSSEIVFEELPHDDPERRKPDIAKAHELLDWAPQIEIEEGITEVIEWFKNY